MTAIRKHLRDFLAVLGMVVIGLGITLYILQEQRLRIPILEEKPFQLKAEFETAQAVVPGQGQTLRVAGVRIGDVSDAELLLRLLVNNERVYADLMKLLHRRYPNEDLESFKRRSGTKDG